MSNTTKKNTDPVWLRIKALKPNTRGSQKALTDWCGLPQNSYSAWDNGTLKSYNKYLDKIAEFYGVSTDWILFGDQQKEKADSSKGTGLPPAKQEAWDLIQKLDDETLSRFIAAAKAMLGGIING